MFWFVIAGVVGVLTYVAFRWLGSATARLGPVAVIIIVAGIAAYNLRPSLSHVDIGQVEALRLLLGFLIGFAAGYIFNVGMSISANVILWAALGVFVFALVAPHFDRWASRLTSFKAAGMEVQLVSLSNAVKVVQPDSREQFLDEQILVTLGDFDEVIRRDIAYVQHFRIPDLRDTANQHPNSSRLKDEISRAEEQLKKLTELLNVFEKIVSPLTRCVVSAIENGYHIESARSQLRPVADQLTKIITLEDRKSRSNQQPASFNNDLSAARSEFWNHLRGMPGVFAPYADLEQAKACQATKDEAIPDRSRQHQDFSELPHFFVARAFLLLFVGNDELALRELQKARHGWKMDDVISGYLMGRVSYFQGEPIDRYIDTLEKMKRVVKDRQGVIRAVTAKCGATCSTHVKEWEPLLMAALRRAEFIALNFIAYGIAQDLAQGMKHAEPLLPIAEDYAIQLKKYIDSGSNLSEEERDNILDTAAFVTIVSQVGRKERDQKTIKEAVKTLDALVARAEQREARETGKKKTVRLALKEMRSHHASGKALLED